MCQIFAHICDAFRFHLNWCYNILIGVILVTNVDCFIKNIDRILLRYHLYLMGSLKHL